ncbi:L-serine ammonia-lyase, iron-sulfur-dependent, subunit alpha [Streptomyces flavidovirens]|uniref:L-serine ammonia-lyase, iron-sulfur-dependent, subunit alpha n=1 Tax=Streptomyces flavidovirens TaxID=67298 RepID=UPI003F55F988
MEHNLGPTCDPVGGLAQARASNATRAPQTRRSNAARMALRGNGTHAVSLDKVIKTMLPGRSRAQRRRVVLGKQELLRVQARHLPRAIHSCRCGASAAMLVVSP